MICQNYQTKHRTNVADASLQCFVFWYYLNVWCTSWSQDTSLCMCTWLSESWYLTLHVCMTVWVMIPHCACVHDCLSHDTSLCMCAWLSESWYLTVHVYMTVWVMIPHCACVHDCLSHDTSLSWAPAGGGKREHLPPLPLEIQKYGGPPKNNLTRKI